MLSDEIRARLELLNRQPIQPELSAGSHGRIARPHLPLDSFAAATVPVGPDEWSARTVRYLPEGCEVENPAGRHLAIRLPATLFGAELAGQLERVAQAWRPGATGDHPMHPDVAALGRCFPHDALFLDLETCGLGSAMVFLVGLLHQTERGLTLELLLARNYAEERAILASLWRIAAGKRILVTFNGKSFDWPLVHDRSTLHRLGRRDFQATAILEPLDLLRPQDPRPELPHFDVLHHARRRWRRRLPNCKLQTLERYLCRRVRRDDVPGHEIPQAYHDYVRTGDTRLMESILHHNALDLVTMTQVAMRMLFESSTAEPSQEPWFSGGPPGLDC